MMTKIKDAKGGPKIASTGDFFRDWVEKSAKLKIGIYIHTKQI